LTEEQLKEKYGDKVTQHMQGPTYDVVSRVFKALTKKSIIIPGSFKSYFGTCAIKCSLGANEGYLYPLERSIFFIHKPPTHIRFDEISQVEFARVSDTAAAGSNKNFDLHVTTKSGTTYQFTNIPRVEYSILFNYITSKKLNIKNLAAGFTEVEPMTEDGAVKSTSSKAPDPYLNKISAAATDMMMDLDEDEEDDEDFEAGGSDDDIPEEYDEEYEGSEIDENGTEKPKKLKNSEDSADKDAAGDINIDDAKHSGDSNHKADAGSDKEEKKEKKKEERKRKRKRKRERER